MQNDFNLGVKSEALQGIRSDDLRDPDFDNFLATIDTPPNFDDLQGFPWGQASSTGLPAALDQPPPNFSFNDLPAPAPVSPFAGPPATSLAQQQHRLLNDQGQAFSMPDLASASPVTSQQFYNRPLVPAQPYCTPASPQGGPYQEAGLPNICEASPHEHSTRERLSGSGSGDLGAKHMSLAERNKQAQRRHRQRQRDRMGTLEAQVKQLTEEKQALAAEKAALAGQTAVLTQVLQMRDEQLQQMRSTPAPAEPPAAVKRDVEDEDLTRSESAVSVGLAGSLSSILTLTVRDEQKIQLNPEQVKAMKPQDVARTWAEYLSAMMRQLKIIETGSAEAGCQAEKRISQLIQEILIFLMRYALQDLHKMKKFVADSPVQADDSPAGMAGYREMWRAAAHNLGLSEQQKKALCQLRLLFLQKQEGLIQQRQRAMASLHGTNPNPASSHDIAAQFLKAEEAMEAIHRNLRMENQLIVDLIYTFLVRVASPIQAARCLVQSFPWYPDTLCILTWIAAEAGDLHALELLDQKILSGGESEVGSPGEASPRQSPA